MVFLYIFSLCAMLYAPCEIKEKGGNMDRKKLEETILAKTKDGKLPCAVCFKIADDLGVPKKEITKVLNEMKIKISQCQLGCFE